MRFLFTAILSLFFTLQSWGQTDPALAGMILMYTQKAEKQLKSQESAMLLMTTGHIWTKEEVQATTDLQRMYNEYLDSFNDIIVYAAQIYGFYHEIGRLTDNFGHLTHQLTSSHGNVVAVALTPKRNQLYRDLIMMSVDIVNDIRQVCLSDIKMTEKERVEIVFGIRPKLKLMNRKLSKLSLAIKYTSLSDVWAEIDNNARHPLDKASITDKAFRRWRQNGKVSIKGSGNGGFDVGPLRPWNPGERPWRPGDQIWIIDSLGNHRRIDAELIDSIYIKTNKITIWENGVQSFDGSHRR